MPDRFRTIPAGAIKIDLPNVAQRRGYTCGPAAMLAVAAYFGVGPGDEDDVAAAMTIGRDGSDPPHLRKVARRWGLRVEEHVGMTTAALRATLDRGRPVVMMVQAWAWPAPRSYRARWRHGHWVVAIGHDRGGVYVEDPALHAARGWLSDDDLDDRWHDWGPGKTRVHRYGLALWRPGVTRSAYARRARLLA
ncbi:MAG: C39 family peptidase [Myxococcales bacterium]|nr:C39 family peptidase [Myxococcales bacterium]